MRSARSYWISAPGRSEIREEPLPDVGPGDVLVKALYGALSRGTEALVFKGRVPESEYQRMRAPFQEGAFPGPVKYGYISVGRVLAGPDGLEGRTVFCLYPHQTEYVAPASAVQIVPDDVPPERAVLAANMETAVNILWDAAPMLGDAISVIGAGVVGCLTARLAAQIPGCDVELVDIDPSKADIAARLGVRFSDPQTAADERRIAINTSGVDSGLNLALQLVGFEGKIVEASWFGERRAQLDLGGAFHARRLTIISSQVGSVPSPLRSVHAHADRLKLALSLLTDDAVEALFTHEISFDDLPQIMPRIAAAPAGVGCVRISYPQ